MRSPALAIAWQFRRHLWGLVLLPAYLASTGAIMSLIRGPRAVRFGDDVTAMALVPVSLLFMYFLAVFSFGLTGDLAARRSIYPARMFALPLSTAALAGWPMICGAIAQAVLLLTATSFARWFWGLEVPLVWPAALAVVFLAWTQALTWMPYGLGGLRILVTVAWLITLDAIVFAAIEFRLTERMMLAFLVPQLPLAYLVAWAAVRRARRGEEPDWRWSRRAEPRPRAAAHAFATPARAQAWFEWRRGGWSLPVMVALVLPFEAGMLLVPGNDTPPVVFATLAAMLLTPPVMAGFAAGMGSRPNPGASDPLALSPLDATRPITTAALVRARLRMTLLSTLAAWVLVVLAVPIALVLSGTWTLVTERVHGFVDWTGTPRATAIMLLALAGLVASTWKKLVQRLYIGLAGRPWITKGSGFLTLAALVAMWPVIAWIRTNRDVLVWLWDYWVLIPAVLVVLKLSAAAWIVTGLHRHRLVSDRRLLAGAAGWVALVLALDAVLVWIIDTPLIPHHVATLAAILAVPLARLSAAPLALSWNRHR